MSNNPTQTSAWKNLETLSKAAQNHHIHDYFKSDAARFEKFSLNVNGVFFDYSKQHVTTDILDQLTTLARECGLEDKREAMFKGAPINTTENRAVLHTALRRPPSDNVEINGENVIHDIHQTMARMKNFSEDVRSGAYKGSTGKAIRQIVAIGVGGSDLGPRLACSALKNKNSNNPDIHFVANIDGHDMQDALEKCHAENTLFIIVSKSFTTNETVINGNIAKDWLKENLPQNADISKHLVGVSAEPIAVEEFGITPDNFFALWEWVNGRFSVWSAVGLSIALHLGFEVFEEFLHGAYEMDQHFMNAPLDQNIPVLMGLIGIWNRNFMHCRTHAVIPYSQKLINFPTYLQQVEMESNGKMIDLDGQKITDYKTAPVTFGGIGTNSQHSFFQLIHQGSDSVPCDFVGIIDHPDASDLLHDQLNANLLAQGQALMQGDQSSITPHKNFEGNKPSSTFLLDRLDAKHLGMLMAAYEHKCFVQGIIWNINSFDQFGVELGKVLSRKIADNDLSQADSSTKGLYSVIHKQNK